MSCIKGKNTQPEEIVRKYGFTKVTDVVAARSSDPLLEEEALRVIKASPDWKPGRVRGKKVRSRMSLNVEFRLEKKK